MPTAMYPNPPMMGYPAMGYPAMGYPAMAAAPMMPQVMNNPNYMAGYQPNLAGPALPSPVAVGAPAPSGVPQQ
jgi:hypothetical protein